MAQWGSRRWLVPVVVFVVVVVAIVAIVPKTIAWVASRQARFSTSTVPWIDVTLVLGAEMYTTGPSPYLQARIDLAAELYNDGKTKVIIASGSNIGGDDEPAGMKAALIRQGVPANKIVLDYGGDDTYSSCLRARDVYGVQFLIVVTQSYHLPRAVATCSWLGMQTYGVGDDSQAHDFKWFKYQAREVFADAKMVYDLTTHRKIPGIEPNDAVQQALNNS